MNPPVEAHTAQPVVLGAGTLGAPADDAQRPAPVPVLALRLLSDERLARLAARGDRNAFGVVFDRHHREIYRYCLSLTRDAEDAADVLQSTMLRALRALEGETRTIALRPWLYRIAHNESIDVLRRRPRADEGADLSAATGWDVEASAESRARIAQLLLDIRELPERQRGALVMRELSGLEYPEIAAALGTSPAGAKQAIYEARRALFEVAKGREMSCEGIQRKLSDGDGRVSRGRALRAHLRECADCRDFAAVTCARRTALSGLTPLLPAGSAAFLRSLLAGGGSGGTAGIVSAVGAPVAATSIATMAVAGALGVGALIIEVQAKVPARESAQPAAVSPAPPAPASRALPAAAGADAASAGASRSRKASSATRRAGGKPGHGGAGRRGSSGPGGNVKHGKGGPGDGRPNLGGPGAAPQAQVTQPSTQGSRPTAPPRRPPVAPGQVGAVPQSPAPVSEVTSQVTTQVDQVRETVGSTVDQVREATPVKVPGVPGLRKRLRRR